MFFCDIALWENFHAFAVHKLASVYIERVKVFFGFPKCSSVSAMLLQLGLFSFSTALHNAKACYHSMLSCSTDVFHLLR